MKLHKLKISLFVLLFSVFFSCQEKNNELNLLIGSWVSEPTPADVGTSSSLFYNFSVDGTFGVITRVVDTNNPNDFIGFSYRAEGQFSLKDGNLSLSYEQIYLADDSQSPPADIEDLILTADEYIQEMTITFSDENSILTFIYPICAPNQNCASTQSFSRLAFFE
jgi:hypothetical protein